MAAALPPLECIRGLLTGIERLRDKCNTRFSRSVLSSDPQARSPPARVAITKQIWPPPESDAQVQVGLRNGRVEESG